MAYAKKKLNRRELKAFALREIDALEVIEADIIDDLRDAYDDFKDKADAIREKYAAQWAGRIEPLRTMFEALAQWNDDVFSSALETEDMEPTLRFTRDWNGDEPVWEGVVHRDFDGWRDAVKKGNP